MSTRRSRTSCCEPTRVAVDSLFLARTVRDIAGAGLAASDSTATALVDSALDSLGEPLEALGRAVGATAGRGVSIAKVRSAAARRLNGLVSAIRAGRAADPATTPASSAAPTGAAGLLAASELDDSVALARWMGADRARWATLVSWAVGACLGDLVGASTPGAAVGVYDAWAAGPAVSRVVGELGLSADDATRVTVMTRALLALPRAPLTDAGQEDLLGVWLDVPAVRAATGWNRWQGAAFVSQESIEEWLGALAARETATGATGAFAAAAQFARSLAARGYQVEPSLDESAG